MDTAGKLLDLLFRRIPPERILKQLCEERKGFRHELTEARRRETFLRFAETTLSGYSEDEQKLLCSLLEQNVGRLADGARIAKSAALFLPLVGFALETLTVVGEEPLCRFQQTLRWRACYHLFGQDLIVCAYLAYFDIQNRNRREYFAWPATLKTDSGTLHRTLEDGGIAENHRHLNGSTQSFDLTWCALMNDPELSEKLPEKFDVFLQTVSSRGPEDNVLSTKERVQVAALVRTILFRALHAEEFFDGTGGGNGGKRKRFRSDRAFQREYMREFLPLKGVSDTVSALKQNYGVPIPLPEGAVCLDYALEREVFHASRDAHYRVLAGERYFLYRCFTASFRGGFTEFEQNLLYLYLLLKTAFRSELIQVNRQVGFQNFSNYQDRKDSAWESGPYWWEAYRMALNAPLATQPIVSMESRIAPAKTAGAALKKVWRYDTARRFAGLPAQSVVDPEKYAFDPELQAGDFREDRSFYVVHFIKSEDDDPRKTPELELRCRHERLRGEVKRQALALAEGLSRSAYLCNRIRGIDGCSNEVVCRPEVFAAAFRFLHNFQPDEFTSPSILLPRPVKRLSQTFHAGEDFYDITDGLRAIDEAVRFLELERGDRIGHALALGVEPEIHYRTKSGSIVLPKQEHLDDLVWLICRGEELDAKIEQSQLTVMRREAERLLREIYESAMRENKWTVTLEEYYCSMLLRGDAPELYKTMRFRQEAFSGEQYDRFRLSAADSGLDVYRNNDKIAGMYYYYHYGRGEKIEGAKAIHVDVTQGYLSAVRSAQNALQRFLERRGVIIECNLTSNVLIGTFGDYDKHPIFRFNNAELERGGDSRRECPQLHVCINTDDLGVFDTSLEFEYALLFQALSKQTDGDGNSRYNAADIMRYVRDVQSMGRQAVFPRASE